MSAPPPAKKTAGQIEKETSSEANDFNHINLRDFDCGSGFQPRLKWISIIIMQERNTRINLAVEPANVLIQPHIGQLKMLDFDPVEHTIEEGYVGVKDKIDVIRALLEPA